MSNVTERTAERLLSLVAQEPALAARVLSLAARMGSPAPRVFSVTTQARSTAWAQPVRSSARLVQVLQLQLLEAQVQEFPPWPEVHLSEVR